MAEKAAIETIPFPDTNTLAYLSLLVDANNRFVAHGRSAMMQSLQQRINYFEQENRTYD